MMNKTFKNRTGKTNRRVSRVRKATACIMLTFAMAASCFFPNGTTAYAKNNHWLTEEDIENWDISNDNTDTNNTDNTDTDNTDIDNTDTNNTDINNTDTETDDFDTTVSDEVIKTTYKDFTLFYSDSYFNHPATEYDSHLATLSAIMTDCTVPRNTPDNTNDEEWYSTQPERLQKFFETIGFKDFDTNKDYRSRTDFDTIGVAAAKRRVGDATVIGIGIRSGGYFREWANNVYLGDGSKSDYMHEGWYNAANKLLAFLDEYVNNNNITGKIKIWITGFSRGGATANIAAGLLDNKIDNNEDVFSNGATIGHDDLYAYTFEAPQGANFYSQKIKKPGDPLYNNIWNIINPNDLVPKVAMREYGFTRFGTDKYITTKFYDPDNFKKNREIFKTLYVANKNDWSEYKADTFEMYGTPIEKVAPLVAKLAIALPYGVSSIVNDIKKGVNPLLEKDNTKKNYDPNIAATLLIEELVKKMGSRNEYCRKYQSGVSNFLKAFMNDVADHKEKELSLIVTRLLLSGVASINIGTDSFLRSVLEDIIPDEAGRSAIVDAVIPFIKTVAKVYWERPNELISMGMYMSEVFQNHDFHVTIAHVEAQDSNYIDEYNLSETVEFRNNADYGRISFFGFNDLGLHREVPGGTKLVIKVNGAKIVKSTIAQCNPGYAVGYYSYLTEEKMEVFTPINESFILNLNAFSVKPRHEVSFEACYIHVGPNNGGYMKEVKKTYRDYVWGDSGFVQKGANIRSNV